MALYYGRRQWKNNTKHSKRRKITTRWIQQIIQWCISTSTSRDTSNWSILGALIITYNQYNFPLFFFSVLLATRTANKQNAPQIVENNQKTRRNDKHIHFLILITYIQNHRKKTHTFAYETMRSNNLVNKNVQARDLCAFTTIGRR